MNIKFDSRKILGSIIGIILFSILVVSFTYAFYSWRSPEDEDVLVGFTVDDLGGAIIYSRDNGDGTGTITGNLNENNNYTTSATITLYKKNISVNLLGHIYLKVKSISTELSDSQSLKWSIYEGEDTTGTLINSGNFYGEEVNSNIPLDINIPLSTTETKYTIAVSLDTDNIKNTNIIGKNIVTEIIAEASATTTGTNNPNYEFIGTESSTQIGYYESLYINSITNYGYDITVTAKDFLYNITNYAVTTTSTTPTSWTSLTSASSQTINHTVSGDGTYYIWFKNSNGNTINKTITINSSNNAVEESDVVITSGTMDNTYFNSDSKVTIPIIINSASDITDALTSSEIKVLINNAEVTNVTKTLEASDNNDKFYTLILEGLTGNGTLSLSLNSNVVKNSDNATNSSTTLNIGTVDNTKPVCTFGTVPTITKNVNFDVELTCTDTGAGLVWSGITTDRLTTKDNDLKIISVSTPTAVTNGYKYIVTLNTNVVKSEGYNLILKDNTVWDNSGNYNDEVNTTITGPTGNTYTVTFTKGSNVSSVGSTSLSCTTTGSSNTCEVTTPTITPSSGYTTLGWALSGSTKYINPGEKITVGGNVTYISYVEDTEAPNASISSTSNFKATSQTATLTCTDNDGVKYYYWGDTAPTDESIYTEITSNKNMTLTENISSTGTYYLSCKDATGNTSTTVSKTYNSYTINNMLLNITGVLGAYNTSNYTQTSTNSTPYIVPSGTTLPLASIYTIPEGASSATFKGYSTGTASTTSASVSTTAPTLTTNSTYSMWFDRLTYTVTVKATLGGTNKVVSTQNTTGVTASSGGTTTLTVRYDDSITATATTLTGYIFTGFTGLSTSTTSPATVTNIKASGTITANFEDTEPPICSIETTNNLKATSQTATLSGSDSAGIVAYYWGTTEPTASTSYTAITSTTNFSTTKKVESAGTYYLSCKDAYGNTSETVSEEYNSYTVNNMLLNITGTEGTYTSSNYSQAISDTYIAQKGTSLPIASIYSIPEGASVDTFKGMSTGVASTTSATLSNTAPTLNANSTYSMWFNRLTYTVTVNATEGGSVKVTSTQNTTGVTASSGSSTTITVRHGDTLTATATAISEYTFTGFTGLLTSTTSPDSVEITSTGNITANFGDINPPEATITTTKNLKAASQTATLTCKDNVGIEGYYWGTTAPTTNTTYTPVNTTTSFSTTISVNNAGTYYLSCKDSNQATTVSQVYYSYTVNNMLLNITGTEGTYTTSNYSQTSTNTYLAPSGTTLTLASIYTLPSGASDSTFKGVSTGTASTSSASVSKTTPILNANTTYSMWFDRLTYTITVTAKTGGTNKVTSTQNRIGVTASSGGTTTITVRHGDTITATASVISGYTFTGFTGLSTSTSTQITKEITTIGTITANFEDKTAPQATITTTNDLKKTNQTATIKCEDSVGVVGYYWGTSSPTTSTTYTSVTSTTSYSTTKLVNSANTYYLSCKDASGNISTTVSKTYYSYTVNNMLLNIKGTTGSYTTSNYTQTSTNTTAYIAPSGTSLTLASIYTLPTGASSSTFKGVSTGAASTTSASVSKTAPTLSANTIYSMWFDRITYTITIKAETGGSNKVTSTQNTIGATASSGGTKTLSVRYGDSITATASANTNYVFSGFSGLSTSTTSPVTISDIKSDGTITASFKDSAKPVGTLTTTNNLKIGNQTATLKCTDNIGVVGYYWGTSSPTTSTTYTSVTSTTSYSTTKTVNSANTYYLSCKDASGNISTTVSKTYYSYTVNNMLLNIKGTSGTYTTTNYTKSSGNTYLAPSGTSLTLASIYTLPTGASSSTFKGISTGTAGTTSASVSKTAPTLTANTTYTMWFDRITYAISVKAGTGGTNKVTSTQDTTGATASSGGSTTLTVRYGDTITATATPNVSSGYKFTGFSGLSSSTSSPATVSNITSTGTITANFLLSNYGITSSSSCGSYSSTADTLANAFSNASSGNTVCVLQDVDDTSSATVSSSKTIKLDLKGNKINKKSNNITNEGSLTITDSVYSSGDTKSYTSCSSESYGICFDASNALYSSGKLTISGGKISGRSVSTICGYGPSSSPTGSVTITGGVIMSTDNATVNLTNYMTLEMTGGTIYATGGGTALYTQASQKGNIEISGGTIYSKNGNGISSYTSNTSTSTNKVIITKGNIESLNGYALFGRYESTADFIIENSSKYVYNQGTNIASDKNHTIYANGTGTFTIGSKTYSGNSSSTYYTYDYSPAIIGGGDASKYLIYKGSTATINIISGRFYRETTYSSGSWTFDGFWDGASVSSNGYGNNMGESDYNSGSSSVWVYTDSSSSPYEFSAGAGSFDSNFEVLLKYRINRR